MKKFLLFSAGILACLLMGCSSDDSTSDNGSGSDGGSGGGDGGGTSSSAEPTVGIKVTDIADNQATVTITLDSGTFYGAMAITGVRLSSVDVDYSSEIRLISYIESNGTELDGLPYTTVLTGLVADQEYFCAACVYDSTGRACASDYAIFTADGEPGGISNDNSAGELDDNPQQ